jgi:23S rRNA (adenine2503-C2)-methyltransferase
MKTIKIPTGFIFMDKYSHWQLETLAIWDYWKANNVKADFLWYTKEINWVPNMECMPMSEKFVITMSTQYWCPMKCTFCDVPNIKFWWNASFKDLKQQLYSAIALFPGVWYTERLNIHFARMGEPSFNDKEIFNFSRWLYINKDIIQRECWLRIEVIHPVFTTSMPKMNNRLLSILQEWCGIKNGLYNWQAWLQLSINSTCNIQRDKMFDWLSLSIEDISHLASYLPAPIGRKYCLNFAYASDFKVDAKKLRSLFPPQKFMVKITPIHNNNACSKNDIKTIDWYTTYEAYKKVEQDLISEWFDVLIFVPSFDEEDWCVTCGNLILWWSELKTNK